MSIELRPDERGDFDEVVADRAKVHIEMMDDKTLWMSIRSGKKEYHIWVSAKSTLRIGVNDES